MPGFMWDLGFWTGYSPPVSAGPCFPAQPLPKAHTHVFDYGALASGAASGSARSRQPPLAARLRFPGGAGVQQPRNCCPRVCRGMDTLWSPRDGSSGPRSGMRHPLLEGRDPPAPRPGPPDAHLVRTFRASGGPGRGVAGVAAPGGAAELRSRLRVGRPQLLTNPGAESRLRRGALRQRFPLPFPNRRAPTGRAPVLPACGLAAACGLAQRRMLAGADAAVNDNAAVAVVTGVMLRQSRVSSLECHPWVLVTLEGQRSLRGGTWEVLLRTLLWVRGAGKRGRSPVRGREGAAEPRGTERCTCRPWGGGEAERRAPGAGAGALRRAGAARSRLAQPHVRAGRRGRRGRAAAPAGAVRGGGGRARGRPGGGGTAGTGRPHLAGVGGPGGERGEVRKRIPTPTPPRRKPPPPSRCSPGRGGPPAGRTRVGGQGAGKGGWADATDAADAADATDTPPSRAPGVPPAPPVGVGRARCGGGDASSPSPRHRLPPPNPPPPHSDAARATVALDCYCAAGGVTVYSHGRRDRRTRTAGSTGSPLAHPRGSPRRRRRGSRRGRPASRGSRSSHAGCSSPHINSYCSGGRAPSGSSSASGNDGDPLLGSPILPPPRSPSPALPAGTRSLSGIVPAGLVPPHRSARQSGSRPPVPSPRLAAGARGDRGPFAERGWRRGRRGGD
ncbi:collagen alpha-1(I) chain-like [Prinia subflava]|uniref:collagen alpha-1(I) chain-like n=1 Tax=Prinia subflava TaxID=208062 RepID=UPI002FE03F22